MKTPKKSSVRLVGHLVVVFGLVAIGIGCSLAQDRPVAEAVQALMAEAIDQVERVSVDTLHTMLERGEAVYVLDIRTEAEHEAGHLPHAEWIPRGKMEFAANRSLPRDTAIIVYCKKHGRSALCALTLKKLGFENVRYLIGGFDAWIEAGHSMFNRHGEFVIRAQEEGTNE